jgi:phosphoribosylformimino-5-aminoimidazole carboxamide ribotide isomerase
MQLIPVLDLMGGVVVRGIAGQRDRYEPNRSGLVDAPDPAATCRAFIDRFAPEWIYIADLDAILGKAPQHEILRQLQRQNVSLAVDAGTDSLSSAAPLLEAGIERIIVGLETLPDFGLLEAFVSRFGAERITFSLDLKSGQPLKTWPGLTTAEDLVRAALACGVRHLIVLDLAGVGSFQGVGTVELCQRIRGFSESEATEPQSIRPRSRELLTIWTGGGVRSVDDLRELAREPVDGVLIASALHDGHIRPEEWRLMDTASSKADEQDEPTRHS